MLKELQFLSVKFPQADCVKLCDPSRKYGKGDMIKKKKETLPK
jgi:hypothetical protein